ncbi:MAG TPA: M1 family aminopeptidase, partial [Thermoanaerobaculia bacterium]|nr:M1 family aminopeptidase [Thermoanaerobaculia bacterium]
LYNSARDTVFVGYVDGRRFPPAMLIVDPLGALPNSGNEQTMMYVSDEMKGGIWYSSHLRSEVEKGRAAVIPPLADASRYAVETTIAPNTEVSGTTVVTVTPSSDLRLLPLNLAAKLRLQEAAYSPAAANPPAWTSISFVQEDEKDDADAAVIFPAAVKAGQPILVKLLYKGGKDVLTDAGDGNYTVGARTSWYPNFGTFDDLADYELKFHVPQKNQIVAVGKEMENRVEGEQRISVWRSSHPLRVAGFNYGRFKKLSTSDKESGMTVDVYTNTGTPSIINDINRYLEATNGRTMSENEYESLAPSGPTHISVDAASLAQSAMADGVNTARTGNFYFGALPDKTVSITQQSQWFFGQSWPSLVYLPYLAFLDGTTRMTLGLQGAKDFVDAVGPHEMAHQWWGHEVGWRSYRDQWLSEGFAHFTAGLVLQQSGGWKTYNGFWEKLRRHIIEKPRGASRANDQSGPISQGWRVGTWQNWEAADAMVYAKGAYVLHMLRMQMWDASKKNPDEEFANMMRDFVATYSGKNPGTADFQRIVEKHLTPQLRLTTDGKVNWFFNQWVYGMAIPRYASKFAVTDAGGGKYRISGTITQSEVPNDFAVVMPLYLQFDKQTIIRFGATAIVGNATKEVNVELALPRKPQAVAINVNHDVLAR